MSKYIQRIFLWNQQLDISQYYHQLLEAHHRPEDKGRAGDVEVTREAG
jgi:hypothetical protein